MFGYISLSVDVLIASYPGPRRPGYEANVLSDYLGANSNAVLINVK